MATAIGAELTAAGSALLLRCIVGSGKTLTFTRGAFGDATVNGVVKTPTKDEQIARTALFNERMSLQISNINTQSSNAVVELIVKNEGVAETFHVREVGLFAKEDGTNNEILYAYISYGAEGFIMPAGGNNYLVEFFYQITTSVSNAENITAVLDRGNLYAKLDDFYQHQQSTNPHPNATYTLPTASTTTKGGIKVGDGLVMDGETLHVTATGGITEIPTASTTRKGGVKVGSGLSMDGDTLNVTLTNDTYTLPTASTITKGGVKIGVGSGLSMDGETLSRNNIFNEQVVYMSQASITAQQASIAAGAASISGNVVFTGTPVFKNGALGLSTGGITEIPTASTITKGGIKVGSGLSMDGDTLNVTLTNDTYTLPTASTITKGGIKVGSGLFMNGETLGRDNTFSNQVVDMHGATVNVRGADIVADNASISGNVTFTGTPVFQNGATGLASSDSDSVSARLTAIENRLSQIESAIATRNQSQNYAQTVQFNGTTSGKTQVLTLDGNNVTTEGDVSVGSHRATLT